MTRKVAERVRASPRGGSSTASVRVVQSGSSSCKRVWTRNGDRSAAVAMVLRRRWQEGEPPAPPASR